MQLYLPHDVTSVQQYLYDPNNIELYKSHCSKIIQGFYLNTTNVDTFTTYEDSSSDEEKVTQNITVSIQGNETSR